ncbi:c-type cytochrome [Asticcacaulis solisilvae]|uniref:c-type cytochrome n=1 Tax=Asticcacaulis solisilvae TaxID=1217274 RepID=UPI003FD78736
MPANRLLLILGAICAVTAVSLPASADTAATVAARSDFFHGLGKSFKGLREELKAPSPDLTLVRKYTGDLAAAAPKLPAQFPAGSGPQPGVKTEAKAEIWSDAAKFQQAAGALNTAAQALNTTAQGSDIAAIRTATGNLGQTCKTCHMSFRQENH